VTVSMEEICVDFYDRILAGSGTYSQVPNMSDCFELLKI